LHYLKDEAESEIPIWRMISAPIDELHARVLSWVDHLGQGEAIPGESTVGGGSLPGETLPTFLLALKVHSPDRLFARLRRYDPPVIARLQDDLLLLDPRTVLPEQEDSLLAALRAAL
jgi:L-seryl-tRNA(Ser) seleniumtransferase